jgi:hypothetical protein
MRVIVATVAGQMALAAVSIQAAPLAPTKVTATEGGLITLQGWPAWQGGWPGAPGWDQGRGRREHCEHLRNRAREISDRMYSAPPWERQGMERHLWEVREQLRGECSGGGRGWD